jgi:hypothetical protein
VHNSTGAALRSAGIIVAGLAAVVLLAIGAGAVAARLAPPDATLAAALTTTTVSALLGGLIAGPVLHRLRQRLQLGTSADPARRSPTGDGGSAAPVR